MNTILIIGSGGREHALAWKLAQSEKVGDIFVAPGNAGTAMDFINVAIDVLDFDGLVDFAQKNEVDLVVVGPEDPLSAGIVDRFIEAGIAIFGPDKASALFESSKDFTKQFLNKHGIATAASFTTTAYEAALEFVEQSDFPLVIKADGLCKGKGVVISDSLADAKKHLKEMLVDKTFGSEGETVVIEEFLEGEEQSLLCFVSNNKIIPMETAKDYKKIYEGDLGPNTGGVGVYSPMTTSSDKLQANIDAILGKIENGLEADGFSFYGILFIGFMIKNEEAKVLEFNVRFGDPETEALLPRLESDLFDVLQKTLAGDLEASDLVWSKQATVSVVMFSEGYPEEFESNVLIDELPTNLADNEIIFHCGTGLNDAGEVVTRGGRVLAPVVIADTLEEARAGAYELVSKIKCRSLNYRRDIAKI